MSSFDFTALIEFLIQLFNAFKALFESLTKKEEAAVESESN